MGDVGGSKAFKVASKGLVGASAVINGWAGYSNSKARGDSTAKAITIGAVEGVADTGIAAGMVSVGIMGGAIAGTAIPIPVVGTVGGGIAGGVAGAALSIPVTNYVNQGFEGFMDWAWKE
jgi:hypothetical protein